MFHATLKLNHHQIQVHRTQAMHHFGQLMQQCSGVKLIEYGTVEDRDPETRSSTTRIMCYIETENAWCDSGAAVCLTREAAREEASKRFLKLMKVHGGNDKHIDNLATRSSSPVSPASRIMRGHKPMSSCSSTRAQSTSPRLDYAVDDADRSETRGRRHSVVGSVKSVFGFAKKLKSPR